MQQDIVAQGVELMLYGMGTVVVFLGLLILATIGMSRGLARFFPEVEPAATQPGPRRAALASTADDPNLVAAISAALHLHRHRK